MNRYILVLFCVFLCAVSSCGETTVSLGGAEAGNPTTTRITKGLLANSVESALVLDQSTNGCFADTAIATDSAARTISASVGSDCSFQLPLVIARSYAVSFALNNAFIASMVFNNGSDAIDAYTMSVSAGDTAVDLGRIVITGGRAVPEQQPALQNDQDDDGVTDFDDNDDDNDGVGDDSEQDCDLDGYLDDQDEEDDTCDEVDSGTDSGGSGNDSGDGSGDAETSSPVILEVNPRNNQTDASLGEKIEARANCAIDESTVSQASFSVSSTTEDVNCSFEFSSSGTHVECSHNDFTGNTLYTVTISGISCEGGAAIPDTTWSFTTQED